VVSRERLDEAVARQAKDHKPIGQILVEAGYAKEEDIISALVAQAGVPYLPLENYDISDDVATMVPKEIALKHTLMPVDRIGDTLLVAMGIPLNKDQKDEVQRHSGNMKVSYFISSWSHIKQKHEQYYA
jgi:type IV pilus assembly protein PilB